MLEPMLKSTFCATTLISYIKHARLSHENFIIFAQRFIGRAFRHRMGSVVKFSPFVNGNFTIQRVSFDYRLLTLASRVNPTLWTNPPGVSAHYTPNRQARRCETAYIREKLPEFRVWLSELAPTCRSAGEYPASAVRATQAQIPATLQRRYRFHYSWRLWTKKPSEPAEHCGSHDGKQGVKIKLWILPR